MLTLTHYRSVAPLTLLALAACAGHTATSPGAITLVPKATAEEQALLFDQLKGLEGVWEKAATEGKPGGTTEFKVTSGGSAVREVMFPGTPHEMTNIYHMDGSTLVTTHYCAAGNQPRMRAVAGKPGVIEFHFDGATNVTSADQPVMGDLTLTFDGKDRLTEHWHSPAHGTSKESTEHFLFTRAKSSAP